MTTAKIVKDGDIAFCSLTVIQYRDSETKIIDNAQADYRDYIDCDTTLAYGLNFIMNQDGTIQILQQMLHNDNDQER